MLERTPPSCFVLRLSSSPRRCDISVSRHLLLCLFLQTRSVVILLVTCTLCAGQMLTSGSPRPRRSAAAGSGKRIWRHNKKSFSSFFCCMKVENNYLYTRVRACVRAYGFSLSLTLKHLPYLSTSFIFALMSRHAAAGPICDALLIS